MAVPGRRGQAAVAADEEFHHLPVMVDEIVELFRPVPAGLYVDATLGGGGHASAVLGARPDLHLLGIDRDPAAVAAAGQTLAPFGDRVTIRQGGFEKVAEFVGNEGIVAILFDLGVSSPQLDRPVRGFSYWADAAPLDMRMDSAQTLTAATVVNEYSEADLAALIARNGEERYARRIAAEIVAARPLETTGDLVEAVKRGIPAPARRRGGHPARRTFQAIRMEVNRELPSLATGLDESVHLLKPEGRMVVLAYHSLEDRMVKERFRALSQACTCPPDLPVCACGAAAEFAQVTRKAVKASEAEVARNPRARSARLRAVEKLR
jgi:16S rRNA (cytosine1402-N4)-methyltransferase